MLVHIQKAARRVPAWQKGVVAPTPEGRAALSIIARNERRFALAFRQAIRDLYATEQMRALGKAIRSGEQSTERILDAMLWFNPADPESVAMWNRIIDRVSYGMALTMQDTGQYTAQRYGFPLKFQVEKAVGELGADLIVPINSISNLWIRTEAAKLVKGLSDAEREKLRRVLARNFERGMRPEKILKVIQRVVGLTPGQAKKVEDAKDRWIANGIEEKLAEMRAEQYADELGQQRARTIARTETVNAHTKGLEESWNIARDNGFIPPGTEKVWEALEDERTSEICEELNGQVVPFDQPFVSSFVGSITRPPAHPNCRSTMTLRFP